jgi:hypothetical protein
MVNATIDNDPVSIQLGPQESVTVPSNEVWKVKVGVHGGLDSSVLEINGVVASRSSGTLGNPYPPEFSMVFKGGDQIAQQTANVDPLVTISGFVVNS